MLVLFLFTPVFVRVLHVSSDANFEQICIKSSSDIPSRLDGELPFEKLEKEEKAATHSLADLPLIAILTEPFLFQQASHLKSQAQQISMKCEQPPRYLVICSLLI
jgi:hypothetical protein